MLHLTEDQKERYKRNILLDGVGLEGQRKLLQSRVLIIGLGGLGSPIAFYLAAAGVGTLGLSDSDSVDLSNLQRQIIHASSDVGRAKNVSAAETISRLNPDTEINIQGKISSLEDLRTVAPAYDFVVDATDNFAARFIINDVCVSLNIPFSHGGISRFRGQAMTIIPGEGACYRCIFGNMEDHADAAPLEEGLFGAVAGVLGSIQAAETLKYLTGQGELLTNRLLSFDARTMEFRKIRLQRQKHCRACASLAV